MKIYYKLLLPDLTHYGFIYTEGLNVLDQPFNPDSDCGRGGLYFSDLDNIFKWLHIYAYNPDLLIACVRLPEDAQVISIDGCKKKYKSDKIILSNIQRLDCMLSDPVICMEAVKQDGLALQFVKEQTDLICMEAVKQDCLALQFVKEQTDLICMEAVKQDGLALQFVKKQTKDICIQAIKNKRMVLKYVNIEFNDICLIYIIKLNLGL
jgi:hypothetical protein